MCALRVCGVLIGLNLDKKSERLRDLGQLDASTRLSSFTACQLMLCMVPGESYG